MAPLIHAMKASEFFTCKVCVTGQHRTMLDQVLDFFRVEADYDLELMKTDQTLADITAGVIKGVDSIIRQSFMPDYIVVQGDTTTAMAGALAAFYSKVKIIHIEAGLRSFDKFSPFPEEVNRVLVSSLADLHFAPTQNAVDNLLSEGVNGDNIWNVGNTVIDALLLGLDIIKQQDGCAYDDFFSFIDRRKKIILVTGHRRENFGEPFKNICLALQTISERNSDVEIVYPVHLNPNIRIPVEKELKGYPNIHLIEPLPYDRLIWLLNISSIVLTDSGGIQEEAPTLGKPVLVMREVTERMEGVEAGTAKLVGTDFEKIVSSCEQLLQDTVCYDNMARAVNPYGNGESSRQIAAIMESIIVQEEIVTQ